MSENLTASPFNATVVRRIDITPRLMVLQVKPDDGVIHFTAGQFIVLGMPRSAPRVPEALVEEDDDPAKAARIIRRAYSISSASYEKEYLEFYISLVSNGALTPRLFMLQPQDRLIMGTKPTGLFTLNLAPADKSVLLVATGTGLAPYISMVRSQLLDQNCAARPMAILHGASYSWDLGFRNELELLAHQCPTFHYLPVVSRPQEDKNWNGRTGRINDWLVGERLEQACGLPVDPARTIVYVCGNPSMMESVSNLLIQRGYNPGTRSEPGTLHMEKYW